MFKKVSDILKSICSSILFSFSVSWKASKVMTIARTLMVVIEAVIPIMVIWVGKLIVDIITNGVINNNFNQNLKRLVYVFVFLILLHIFSIIMTKARQAIESTHIDLINYNLDRSIMEKAVALDLSYFDSPKLYNQLNLVQKDLPFLQHLIWSTTSIINSVVSIVASMILLGRLHWVFPLVVIAACIPNAITERNFTVYNYNFLKKKIGDERKYNYIYSMFFDRRFVKDLRLYDLKDYFIGRYVDIWRKWQKERANLLISKGKWSAISSLFPVISIMSVQIFTGIRVILGSATLGDYTLYAGLVSNSLGTTAAFFNSVLRIYESDMRIKAYTNFLKWEYNVYPCGDKSIEGVPIIEFRNVSFKYPNTNRYVLKNINFEIAPYEKVALVGLNGAGKTTLTKLLMRFYEPTEGQILINGLDIHEYDEKQIKKLYSAVFQDFPKYAFSLRESIAMTDIENIDNEIKLKEACKNSGAADFIEKWPNKYDTFLTRNFEIDGEELSGGQWQKVALASAFFRNAGVLVLDEPTASLDPQAEYDIFKNFTSLGNDKSVVLISHRLSSVVMADKIVVLEDHTIVESGSHKELMDKNGRYARLFRMQAEKYMDENVEVNVNA